MSPYDRALGLCPDDKARLELGRISAELGLGTSSQEWIVLVLYAEARRLFGASDAGRAVPNDDRVTRLEAVASRIERVASRLDGPSAMAAKPSRRWPLLGILAIVALIGLASWFAGASTSAAHIQFANRRVATLLTTPAGTAALGILDANGAELPQNLLRCKPFIIQGRAAHDCVLWSQGPAPLPKRRPLWFVQLVLQTLPAWPFALLAAIALVLAAGLAAMKTGPRIRQI